MPRRDIILVGGSAGAVEAVCELVKHLPPDLPAAVFVVIHLGRGRSSLPQILDRAGALPALHPEHGEPIRSGRIYVAPPDRHMVVDDGTVRLLRGPRENGFRPAVDVLFRSAARRYRERVIGVVLTGNLDDGTAGLLAVKTMGGVAVVQDPADASHPSMPENAIAAVAVDHVVSLAELPALLAGLAGEPVEPGGPEPVPVEAETHVTDELVGLSGEDVEGGEPSGFTCPDCGGALWEWGEGELVRYRCRTGHAYSPESLVAQQSDSLEYTLWAAVRTLEETAAISKRMAKRMRRQGMATLERRFRTRAAEAERHADTLRGILTTRAAETVAAPIEEPAPQPA